MPSTPRAAWIAWAAVCLIWGTTYLAIKVALDTIPPFLISGLRCTIGGAVLLAWLAARGQPLPVRAAWPHIALQGFLMLTLGNGGVAWGEQYLASGLTAVLIATSPFWMVAIESAFPGGERVRPQQWLGVAVGFAGIVLLVGPDLSTVSLAGDWHVVAGIVSLQVACIGWAVASSLTRRRTVSRDVLGVAAMQLLFGGVILLAVATASGEWPRLSFTPRTFAALAYLVVAGSIVAFAAYSYALRHLPVSIVSMYTYVNPVIAVALGTLLLGEPFRLSMLVAVAVILAGIALVRR
ncbi:MAG TPA: EamA family transporter [Vicinamibacterales bacterium]|nr:EamA family transporter [Vicinamibacterales bacterium]